MIVLPEVQNLVATWWYEYDEGCFESWPDHFTADARFTCRSDSGQTDFEEFIRADLRGRDEVVFWQRKHRSASPYPLRHNGTNIHLSARRSSEVDFRSYLFVTHIVGGAVTNLSSGIVNGTVRAEDGRLRFSAIEVVLDFTDSAEFSAVRSSASSSEDVS